MDSLEDIKTEAVENVSEAKNVLVEKAKEAVDEIEFAGEKVIEAVTPEQNVNWEKAVLIGLGIFSIGVVVIAGISIYKGKDDKKKKSMWIVKVKSDGIFSEINQQKDLKPSHRPKYIYATPVRGYSDCIILSLYL